MTREEAILSDVPRLRVRRLKFIAAIRKRDMEIALLQREVDKMEERFDEVGLAKDGIEK